MQEVKDIMRPDDITLVYPAWSIFTGTPIERWLAQWGARTLIISGYHTDWCVEMAVRSARDMGFMPVVIGDADKALAASHMLESQGYLVIAIRPPTVPRGTARLRITFTAAHPDGEIEKLADIVRGGIIAAKP